MSLERVDIENLLQYALGLEQATQDVLYDANGNPRIDIPPTLDREAIERASHGLAGDFGLDELLDMHLGRGRFAEEPRGPWLESAATLLAEPDPGPTPMLVDGLIVDRSLAAIVGRWKHGKTWGLLELGISVATGLPAFGVRDVPTPGPVILVLEESGRAALHRRLDALARGRAIPPEQLRDLHAAANQRVRLDDPDWQKRLTEAANELQARAVFLDPIARLRRAGLDENSQREYAVVIEAIRDLRDNTNATVAWVAHTGHTGENMRGSSDLESVWESRLAFKRDGDTVSITAEHREAEPGDPLSFELAWHHQTRTMRLRSTTASTDQRCVDYLADNAPATTDEIASGVNIRRSDVKRVMDDLSARGTARRQPVPRTDKAGRHVNVNAWILSSQAALSLTDAPSHNGTAPDGANETRRTVPPLRGVVRDGTSDGTAEQVLS